VKKFNYYFFVAIISIGIFFLQFATGRAQNPQTFYKVYLDNEIIGIIESREELDVYINRQGDLIRNQVIEYQQQLEIIEAVDAIVVSKFRRNEDFAEFFALRNNYRQLSILVYEDGSFRENERTRIINLIGRFPEEYRTNVAVGENSIANYSQFINKLEERLLSEKSKIIRYIEENRESMSFTEIENHRLDRYLNSELEEVSYIRKLFMQEYVEQNTIYLYAENIYTPLGINIMRIKLFEAELTSVSDVYQAIIERKPNTIEGYQFRIRSPHEHQSLVDAAAGTSLTQYNNMGWTTGLDDVIIFVTDPDIFEEAVRLMQTVFAGTDQINQLNSGNAATITGVGRRLEDIYVEEDITIKKTNISVREQIFTDPEILSSYLLYGEEREVRTVRASAADNIPAFAFRNGISVEEFFLSNPSFTSVNNMFYNGQEVVIAQIDPKVSIVVETFEVEDVIVPFEKIERFDANMTAGSRFVEQVGSSGVERVSQNIRTVNGQITVVEPVGVETITEVVNEITILGTRRVPTVGRVDSWGWPTASGYRVTSWYGWRLMFGRREFHTGIDIAVGHGTPIFATNNGIVVERGWQGGGGGNVVTIDHNNGYWTHYAHLSSFAPGVTVGTTVTRGQVIGFMGCTGRCTGTHLHFEIRRGCGGFGCHVDPWPYIR